MLNMPRTLAAVYSSGGKTSHSFQLHDLIAAGGIKTTICEQA